MVAASQRYNVKPIIIKLLKHQCHRTFGDVTLRSRSTNFRMFSQYTAVFSLEERFIRLFTKIFMGLEEKYEGLAWCKSSGDKHSLWCRECKTVTIPSVNYSPHCYRSLLFRASFSRYTTYSNQCKPATSCYT